MIDDKQKLKLLQSTQKQSWSKSGSETCLHGAHWTSFYHHYLLRRFVLTWSKPFVCLSVLYCSVLCYFSVQSSYVQLTWKVLNLHGFFPPEITCQDEDSNQYFEGATWSVGKCIDCRCVQGTIYCSRKVVLASFLLFTQKLQVANEVTFTEYCNQTECNVATYIKRNKGICHG